MQTRIDPQGFRLRTVLNKGIPKNAFAESVVYLWTNQPKFPRGVGCWKINFVIVDFDASIEARLETDGNFGADRKLGSVVKLSKGGSETVVNLLTKVGPIGDFEITVCIASVSL